MILAAIVLTFVAFILALTIIGIFSGGNEWSRFVAIGFDMFWNILTGGQIDMTISSRARVAALQGQKWGIYLQWFLNKLETNHCQLALEDDIVRAQTVINSLSPYK